MYQINNVYENFQKHEFHSTPRIARCGFLTPEMNDVWRVEQWKRCRRQSNKLFRENSTKSMEWYNTTILKDIYASLSCKYGQGQIKETKTIRNYQSHLNIWIVIACKFPLPYFLFVLSKQCIKNSKRQPDY